jgi:hypothetical protein
VAAGVGAAVALAASLRPREAAELDRHWEAGALEAFARTADAAGLGSPSLHRALAAQALERGDVATSVRELFSATADDDTFFGRSRLLDDLAVTQESLGLTKTIFDGAMFRAAFLRGGRWIAWLFAAAAWILVVAGFARWYAPARAEKLFVPSIYAAVALALVAAGSLGLGRLAPPYAVLAGPGAVPLFRSAQAVQAPNDASGRLAELPAGTIVAIDDSSADPGATRLVEPFGGWIPKERATPVRIGVRN